MVKIRLKRMGAKKRPFYRLVVADARSPRDGKFIESLGWYDPLPDPVKCEIDAEKVKAWLVKGARPSDSARRLLQQQGLIAKTPYVAQPKSAEQKHNDELEAMATAKTEKEAAAAAKAADEAAATAAAEAKATADAEAKAAAADDTATPAAEPAEA